MKYINHWKEKVLSFLYEKKMIVLLISSLVITYPISAWASNVVIDNNLSAPFLWDWVGAWVFAFAGGLSSLFIKIDDVDKNVRLIYLAKPFMGTFSAIAVGMFLVEDVNAPGPTLVFYCYFVSLCCSPLIQGLLNELHKDTFRNKIFGFFLNKGK